MSSHEEGCFWVLREERKYVKPEKKVRKNCKKGLYPRRGGGEEVCEIQEKSEKDQEEEGAIPSLAFAKLS